MIWALTLLSIVTSAPAAAVQVKKVTAAGVEQRQRTPRINPLEHNAGVHLKGVDLLSGLIALRDYTGLRITFSPSLVPDDVSVTCDCAVVSVREALDHLLAGTGLRYTPIGNHIVIEPQLQAPAAAAPPQDQALARGEQMTRVSFARYARTTRMQQGTISGQVTDAATARPLSSVQISIEGTGLGALTDDQGQYTIADVPAGEAQVIAMLIGFTEVTRTVTVPEGGTVTADFELKESAVNLNEIVVTGTPGGTQRRALGNNVPRLEAAEVVHKTAPTNVDALLGGGRIPGVDVSLGSGNVGGGGQIRIRGMGSSALSNYPLIYVDGIRVSNAIGGPEQRDGNAEGFRLNDLNPDEIESIEIVKGPSAATLYGTEASAGVVQIITKRGAEGATTFSAKIQQGANFFLDPEGRLPTHYWLDGETRELLSWHPINSEVEAGFGSPLSVGPINSYQLSASGGTDRIRYYVDGSYGDSQGYVDYNTKTSTTLRTNLDAMLSPTLNMALSMGLIGSDAEFGMHPSPYSLTAGFMYGHPGRTATRGWYAALPEEEDDIEATSDVNRMTWSAELSHEVGWFSQRLTIGQDFSREHAEVLFERQPEGAAHRFGQRALGDLSVRNVVTDYRSLDYSASADLAITPALSGQTSLGVQYYTNSTEIETAIGQEFPAPEVTELDAAARTFAAGSFIENKTFGMYVQQQLGWNGRLFLTGALRGDDNSAFGTDYEAAIYPKLSASWVLNEEPFWENVPIVNAFRLRGAWGKAGRNPDVFAATTLYNAVTGPSDQIAVQQGSPGNSELGPEVGVEIEAGFDAGLWNDRLGIEFTFYDKTTKDALLLVPIPLSTGFLAEQWTNLGEINNRGIELAINADVLQTEPIGWQMGLGFATNRNEVVSLGGTDPVIDTGARTVEGYPLNGHWIPDVVSGRWQGDPLTDPDATPVVECRTQSGEVVLCDDMDDPQTFYRPQTPTWSGGVNTTLTLWRNLSLFANVEFAGGHGRVENGVGNLHRLMRSSKAINGDPNNGIPPDPVVAWAASSPRAVEWLLFAHGAGFARLRELSSTYRLPSAVTDRFRLSSASVTLAARNLWFLWQETKQHYGINIVDPELRAPDNLTNSVNIGMWPASSFVATLRVRF